MKKLLRICGGIFVVGLGVVVSCVGAEIVTSTEIK